MSVEVHQPAQEGIKVWRPADLTGLELHRGLRVRRSCPKHWHDEFHLCVIESGVGDLRYRGTVYPTPAGSLFIVAPGEPHANDTPAEASVTYRNIYASADLLHRAVAEVAGHPASLPFFPAPLIFDHDLHRLYLDLHLNLELPSSRLARESLLLTFLTHLITRYAEGRPQPRPLRQERGAVKRVREYLIENYAENVSLESLAAVAGLSPFHLSRVFRDESGMPPHAFQTQVRILRAKSYLQQGWPIARVASQVGFADQSHFTRHFKRVVGVTPGHYLQSSKNVQD